ncbi:MAG: response regulator [bacterium]|nr:response regulator [bacterium]
MPRSRGVDVPREAQQAAGEGAERELDAEGMFLAERHLEFEHTRDADLASRSKSASVAYVAILLVVLTSTDLIAFYPIVAYGTLALSVLAGAGRFLVSRHFERLQAHDADRASMLLISCTLMAAGTWGLFAGFTLRSSGDGWASLLVLTCSAGVLAGGSTTIAIHRSLHVLFLAAITIPLVIGAVLLGEAAALSLAILFVLFAAILFLQGLPIYREYWDGLVREALLDRAREEAVVASEAKSLFLANMSHEIRTPMNGILGMTDIVLESQITHDQRGHLQMVKMSAQTLLTVINDILDFSKVEAGMVELEAIEFPLRKTIGDTLRALGVRAQEQDLELAFDVAGDVPERLIGDPVRLRQVLINLVGNAIKFTHEGHVLVRASARGHSQSRVRVRFEVIDTGVGIDEDKQARIFDSFTQADSSMARKYGGTGLGLSISGGLVELMGGRIVIKSELGVGSEFSFDADFALPLDAVVVPPELLIGPRVRRLRVLVVDEREISRDILLKRLRDMRVPALTVTMIQDVRALAEASAAQGHPLTHLLVDDRLLVGGGLELLSQIEIDEALGCPALVLMRMGPGHVRPHRRRTGDPEGPPILSKPLTMTELAEALKRRRTERPCTSGEREGAPPAVPTPSSASGPEDGTRNRRVLLAEDNPVNVLVAKRLLERAGLHVTHAPDGQAAVDLHEQQSFDVILMDIQMPGMNGFEATAVIREREAAGAPRTPIVALTAHAMRGDEERCIEAGMDGYTTKPIIAPSLFAELQRVLGLPIGGSEAA